MQPIFFRLSFNDRNTQLCQKSDIWVPEDTEKEELRDFNAVHMITISQETVTPISHYNGLSVHPQDVSVRKKW